MSRPSKLAHTAIDASADQNIPPEPNHRKSEGRSIFCMPISFVRRGQVCRGTFLPSCTQDTMKKGHCSRYEIFFTGDFFA